MGWKKAEQLHTHMLDLYKKLDPCGSLPDRVSQHPAQAEASGRDGLAGDMSLCVN